MGERRLAELVAPEVVVIAPETSVRQGLERMCRRGISCLVVVEHGRPVGIVTERNIVWAAARNDPSLAARPVRDIMSSPVRTIGERTSAFDACQTMVRSNVRHLVLVDEAGAVLGVLSQSDLVGLLGDEALIVSRRVADIMIRDVVTAPQETTVGEAVSCMAQRAISCLVVTRSGRPVGMVTECDVVHWLLDRPGLGQLHLAEIMSRPVVSVKAGQSLFEAAMCMQQQRMRRLVVVDGADKVVGLVTQTDIVRAMASPYVQNLESALEEKNAALQTVGQSLLRKSVFLDNLLRCAEMGIVAVDETWRITYCNPEAEGIFDVRADMLIGRDLRQVHAEWQVDVPHFVQALAQVAPDNSYGFDFDLAVGGSLRRFAAWVSGIYDTDGAPGGYVLMVRDDTKRRQAEESLERLTRNLETLVVQRTHDLANQARELERANQRLRGIDEVKSAFLSSVSHELRTPLTSLLGFAKLIARDFGRYFSPLVHEDLLLRKKAARIEDNLKVLSHEGERLARLLNDFLDLSRIESGRMHWRDRHVALTEVIDKAVAAVAGLFEARPEVDLETRLPALSPVVLADPDRLEQVLLNLLGNAVKFTAVGGVTVSLYEPKPGLARVVVTDTGPGIAPQDREIIFDKFRQVGSLAPGTVPAKGTGLGLAICREIVTHYGGRIWVEPAPGRGSAFLFELPTTRVRSAVPEAASYRSEERERPLVLVVDDDPAVSSFLIQFLEGEGYQVASAHDGTSALSAAAKLKPSVITMDMAMPGMDGASAMAALRRDPELAAIPVLVITGQEGAISPAADAVLTKPLQAERLLAEVRRLVHQRHGEAL